VRFIGSPSFTRDVEACQLKRGKDSQNWTPPELAQSGLTQVEDDPVSIERVMG